MPKAQPDTFCYCGADGVLQFGGMVPTGSLPVVERWTPECGLDHTTWKATIAGFCRKSYDGKKLIPGIPEAGDQVAALGALTRFSALCKDAIRRTRKRVGHG